MKILLAEPEAASRQALEDVLVTWGYDVTPTADGTEAWVALQGAEAPRLAVLGSGLPGMDRSEICRKLRERTGPYAYVLLLTPADQKQELVAGFEAGADDFVAKPVDEDELKARLRAGRRILDLQDALRDAQEAFRFEARHDPLTAVWNRAAILDVLRQELARAIRERTPVGLVLADVDRFKAINESHGHAAGDAVLREAVRRVSKLVRPYDGIGRYATEEFLIVLPGCDAARAQSMAERIRESIAAPTIQLAGAAVGITVSLGVTSGGEGGSVGPESLIAAADAALERAIKAGGNRVEVASARDLTGKPA